MANHDKRLTCMVCGEKYEDAKTTAVFRFLCSMKCQRKLAKDAGFVHASMTIEDFNRVVRGRR